MELSNEPCPQGRQNVEECRSNESAGWSNFSTRKLEKVFRFQRYTDGSALETEPLNKPKGHHTESHGGGHSHRNKLRYG